MARERVPTYPEIPRAEYRCRVPSAPGIPGMELPVAHADHCSIQPGEDVQRWMDRQFRHIHNRVDRVERKVGKAAKHTLLAALLPSIIYLTVAIASLLRGHNPPPFAPPALAAQKAP